MSTPQLFPGPKPKGPAGQAPQMSAAPITFPLALHETWGDAIQFKLGPAQIFMFRHPAQVQEIFANSDKFGRSPNFSRAIRRFVQWYHHQ